MLVSPLAGSSGALPPAQLTLAGQVSVCVPPAVTSSVSPSAVLVVLGTLVKENVVAPDVVVAVLIAVVVVVVVVYM